MNTTQTAPFTDTLIVELDSKLKPQKVPSSWGQPSEYSLDGRPQPHPRFAQKVGLWSDLTSTSRGRLDPKRLAHDGVLGNVFHSNYLCYLERCWANHWTPVLTPDILWFTLLNEVATLVRENSEKVRDLFTVSAEKTMITVQSDDLIVMPVNKLVARLTEYVPTAVDSFLPSFTTTTQESRLAFCAAFCDVVSPYYSYGMFCCGLPAIEVKGTLADYIKVAESWRALPKTLHGLNTKWSDLVQKTLEQVAVAFEAAPRGALAVQTFWGNMFTAGYCGSGSQIEVDGWFAHLFRQQPKGPRYAGNFDTHAAKVDYKQLDTGREFSMLAGLFSSELSEDGRTNPLFSQAVFETTPIK